MTADRRVLVQSEDVAQKILRGAEFGKRIQENRDVAMDPPFVPLRCLDVRKCGREIQESDEASIPPALDHLMQIDAVVEPPEPFHGVPIDAGYLEGCRELKLEDANPASCEALQALWRVLELNSGMADVVAKAQVAS